MNLRFYNSMGRELQDFVPLQAGKAGMYCCGPTVYNYAHIGNLRTYIFEDILRRVLEYAGYEVTHVMNITDVGHLTDDADEGEDKMEKSARETGRSVWDIAEMYTRAFFNDTDRLNITRPAIICKATDHIAEMTALVERLGEKGVTYEAGGNVYLSIDKFPDYGRLALLDKQELLAGARIAVDAGKRNPRDFVLWFTKSKFENQTMLWDSPWGRGYPGWHLECSAMSMKYLGEQFDIHCGGIDHIPV
ncbi:MAG: cysteine--tRNA ligase, partial [Spirochaetaceae bacterium]|nr:cysteine--tRNA ligase [Spirochaetaceae bacterium]